MKLDETGADGLVPISSLGREYFRYDPDAQTLTGETLAPRASASASACSSASPRRCRSPAACSSSCSRSRAASCRPRRAAPPPGTPRRKLAKSAPPPRRAPPRALMCGRHPPLDAPKPGFRLYRARGLSFRRRPPATLRRKNPARVGGRPLHSIPLAALCVAVLAGDAAAGANPPLETSPPPLARAAPSPQPASFAAWRDGFRAPRARPGHRARRSSTPPSQASASTPRWCGSTAARPSSPSRSGSTSTAPPRPTASPPAAPSAPRLDPTLAAIERPLRRRRRGGAGDLGHGVELRRLPRRHRR